MTLAVVYTRASVGIAAPLVTVEAHISNGLPGLSIVGLPEAAVKESKDRVRSALLNSHFEFPSRRITINLAPADLPKEGGRFDLPIALGILAASQQIPLAVLQDYEFAGELALSGELRAIHGAIPLALSARSTKRALILPLANAEEAALSEETCVYAAKTLLDVYAHLTQQKTLPKQNTRAAPLPTHTEHDLAEVQGQPHAKRALEIAAAGGHSLLMVGPPGTGKTMLASRLPSILPPLTAEEALEVAALYSLIPHHQSRIAWGQRPFRSPHHTASAVALVGGGGIPRPGEISLAHRGILFLDELPEFNRRVLEVLREPLESGSILIARAARYAEFPARFQLIAAMNPCPCGQLGNPRSSCQCTVEHVKRYRARLSGPLLDRIDMHVEVPTLSPSTFTTATATPEETSATVRARVLQAHAKQYARSAKLNATLTNREGEQLCPLTDETRRLMQTAMERFGLSARSFHRILRLARTIADLAGSDAVCFEHLSEALSFRKLDRSVE